MAHLYLTTLPLILVICRVDAPGGTVRVEDGDDAILPCNLPCNLHTSLDNITLKVKWECGKTVVHFYRSFLDDSSTQDNKFKGRTSLFYDKLDKGNTSLKLTKVTEQDAGNYTCTVHNKNFSHPKKCYVILELLKSGDTKNQTDNRDPEENRNEGNQTDSDKKENNNDRHHGLIALCIIPVAVIVAIVAIGIFIRRTCVNNNPGAGQDGRGQHQQVETDKSRDEGQESGAGRDGRGQDDQVETDDSRDKGPKLGAGPDGRGQYEQIEMVKMVDSRDEGRVEDETGEDNT